MTASAEALREIHRLHQQATDLRDRLARGPKQVKSREANLQHVESELEVAKEKHTRTRMTIDDKELSLKQRENRILDIRAKLNSCSSNREYQAFVEQIAADEQANSVLSDEILELLDKVQEDQDAVEAASRAVADIKSQLADVKNRVAEEKEGLAAELERVEGDLVKAETSLPPDIRQEYDRVVKAHGEEALAPMEEDVCGGCYQRVTSQMLNELQLGKMVFCQSCGRLLYLPEDTRVG